MKKHNQNQTTTLTPTELAAQHKEAAAAREYAQARDEAYKAADRGKRVARQAIKIVQEGKTDGRAVSGRFPYRYMGLDVGAQSEVDSARLAANAELKDKGVDIDLYKVYGGTYDNSQTRIAVTHINGEEQAPSAAYASHLRSEALRAMPSQEEREAYLAREHEAAQEAAQQRQDR